MATLTETARVARQGIIAFGILVVLIAVGTITWRFIPVAQPEPVIVPTPTPAILYGKLPPLTFPQSKQYPAANLKLETISGGPPVSTSSAFIYFVPQKAPNLFSRRNAVSFAATLGFSQEPKQLSTTTLSFANTSNGDTLVIDITTKNFTFKKGSVEEPAADELPLPSEVEITNLAREYFTSKVDWDNDLSTTRVTYYTRQGGTVQQVEKKEQAQIARVDFQRGFLGGWPVVYGELDRSDTYILFIPGRRQITTVLEASYQNFSPDIVTPSTYPTISGLDAWEKFRTGGGYVAVAAGEDVTVREGYLAYFQESNGYHPFFQPVYVFLGDRGFTGMVPAIDPTWIGQ